jgi:hypothetical protein
MEYPKQTRTVNKDLIKAIMEEQGVCLVGFDTGDFGPCSDPGYDPHHIQTRGSGGNDERGNIIRLCRYHHNSFHNGKIPREYLEELLDKFYSYTNIWTPNRK